MPNLLRVLDPGNGGMVRGYQEAGSPETAELLAQVGAALMVLGLIAFLANRLKFSVVPFYLLLGLAMRRAASCCRFRASPVHMLWVGGRSVIGPHTGVRNHHRFCGLVRVAVFQVWAGSQVVFGICPNRRFRPPVGEKIFEA